MKKTVVSLVFLVSAMLFAKQEWKLVFHSTYIPTLEKEMGEMISAGYDPVGIEYVKNGVENSVLTMYEKTDDLDFSGMKIIEVFDTNSLFDTTKKEAQNGYLPMDLTWCENHWILLFVKYDNTKIKDWALDTPKATYTDIGLSLENFASKGREWVPVGITGAPDIQKYILMYLKIPDVELQDYNVYTFDGLENFQSGIDQLYADGWSVCGFSIYGNEWDVVCVKIASLIANIAKNTAATVALSAATFASANIEQADKDSKLASFEDKMHYFERMFEKIKCDFGGTMIFDEKTKIQIPEDYKCEIMGDDVIVTHRSGQSEKVKWWN